MKFSNIKKIRKEFNLTQKEIASILNVDRTTYTGWETGKNTIPLAKLLDFSNYFKYSIDYILGTSKNNNFTTQLKIDLVTIGKNLKKIRKKFNLTQNDICKFLKIAKSTYSSYETGKILIQTQYIYKIAKKFNFGFMSSF